MPPRVARVPEQPPPPTPDKPLDPWAAQNGGPNLLLDVARRDLYRWSDALAGIARTGLAFTASLYERERFEEVLRVAADIRTTAEEAALDEVEVRRASDHFLQEWLSNIGEGVPGYVTPKVAVGAVVGNEGGEILLVQRADSGLWLYPTGWADAGYSAAEVAVKEVREETGIECEPVQLLAVIDGQRAGFSRFAMYLILFHCRATGGELQMHPLEASDLGWFHRDHLPPHTVAAEFWAPFAFAAIDGHHATPVFDPPRADVWRGWQH